MDTPDPEKASWTVRLLALGGTFVTAGVGMFMAMWKSHGKRIGVLEQDMKGKASNDELKRQRDRVVELFQGQEAIKEDMNRGFASVTKAIHDLEVAWLKSRNDSGGR